MEVDEASSKSSGFFKIFDWGKKPKRKLFASSPASDKITDGKEAIDNVSSSRSNVVEDDDAATMSSIRGTSECSSSVTEEEGIIKRPPGVVARLMGLDSIPISMQSDPLSPPLHPCLQKRAELRPHKMPSSPIERFQSEMIPSKMGKTIPLTRYKPLSPIKSSAFVSGRNAAQIMEVASRIIEPGLNLAPMRVYDSGSLVRGNPKPVNRRLNVLEGGSHLTDAKSKRKTTVPLNQGRTNISNRDGTRNPSRTHNHKRTTQSQNNRKQNTTGTKKGTQRLVNGEISSTGDTSFGKSRVANQLKGSKDSKMAKKTNSRTRKLNTISEASHATSTNNNNYNNILVRRSERHINRNLMVEPQMVESQMKSTAIPKRIGTNGINTSNIVSFTFTSPVDKIHSSQSPKADLSHMGAIDGDYLGILLEQKLRELTCGSESPYKRSLNMIPTSRCESELVGSIKAETGGSLKESESLTSSGEYAMNETDREKETGVGDQENNLSPFSTLEALPSIESCNSSESLESSKGIKSCTSFHFNEVLEVENEASPSESDYSLTTTNDLTSSEIADASSSFRSTNTDTPELALMRDIISSISITEICCNGLRFDELEKEEEKYLKTSQKLLLGCAHQFLEAKCGYFFGSGYQLWSQGCLYIKQLSAEKLFKEIRVEKGVEEEGMEDMLVDADMSSRLGKWVVFEIESFETGAVIASEVLDLLIDEMVAELL